MKRFRVIIPTVFLLISLLATRGLSAATGAGETVDITGVWQGALKIQAMELRLVVHLSADSTGAWAATMDSPDQGAFGIPIDKVKFNGDSLRFDVAVVRGFYEGKFVADSLIFNGHWNQGGMSLPLKLTKVDKAPEIKRPQLPQKPYPYDEEEVSYRNETAAIQITGTLTSPRGDGPFPAVLLISGSGAQDRDESLFNHKPFLVLSDYLTRRGIAVLRVDDRGVGGTGGSVNQSTSEDFASDVLAGVQFLKNHPRIDKSKIGLIGHSEGGLIAPMAAARSGDVAFIVLMAGPGLTGEEILYLQAALISRASGQSEEAIEENRVQQEQLFTIMKSEPNDSLATIKIKDIVKKSFEKMTDEERKQAGDVEEIARGQAKRILTPWFRYFLTYDPRIVLGQVKCPVLAINGGKDLQVPPKENLTAIEKALKDAGNNRVTIREIPDLNHLFQTSTSGAPMDYGKIEETMAPAAMAIIGDWIVEVCR
ncbi:MAG: alpha/beta hydrolase family protein [Candidatus Zhuqueibacterota bacterium]